jgi:hypothetical protein
MSILTQTQIDSFNASFTKVGGLIQAKSMATMEAVAVILPIYKEAKGNLAGAFEEAQGLLDALGVTLDWNKSTTKRCKDINTVISNLVEFNLWRDEYQNLTYTNLETLAKMLSHMYKYGKEGKTVTTKAGKQLSAKTVFPIMVEGFKSVMPDLLEAINKHSEAECIAKNVPFVALEDLWALPNASKLYDDKMSDKIAHLKSEFKLDEDEAKISATLGSLFAKLSPEAQLAFVQKMSAQIQTPQNNVEEVAQEIGA